MASFFLPSPTPDLIQQWRRIQKWSTFATGIRKHSKEFNAISVKMNKQGDNLCNRSGNGFPSNRISTEDQVRKRLTNLLWLNRLRYILCCTNETKRVLFIFTDEHHLSIYIRGCKYDLDKAKTKYENNLKFRTSLPEIFTGWDPLKPELQAALSAGYLPIYNT